MTTEKRWAKRLELSATIKLESISSKRTIFEPNHAAFEVEVVNISKGGMAFRTTELLPLNSFYNSKVVLWTKESFDALIEIVRMENLDDDDRIEYGCRFVGISHADQFKMDVYDIVNNNDK